MNINNFFFRSILELRAKRQRSAINNEKINSNTILVVATVFLGDLFMLSPFIEALKRSKPDVEIVLVCNEDLKELASLLNVKHIVPSKRPSSLSIKRINKLSISGYEAAYCIFSGVWLSAMIDIPVKKVVSFPDPSGRLNHLITEMVDFPKLPLPAIKIPLLMLNNNQIDDNLIALDSWKPSGETAIVHVGARSLLRRMPISLMSYIINVLNNKSINIIVTSGPNEFDNLEELRTILPANVFNQINFELGSKKLQNLIPTIISSKIVIGIDTGFLHLTKALGVPTLVLLGQSQADLFGGDNFYSRSIHLGIHNLSCRDKKTFHGLNVNWINKCDRDYCHVVGMPCLGSLEMESIKNNIYKLLDLSLETKALPISLEQSYD